MLVNPLPAKPSAMLWVLNSGFNSMIEAGVIQARLGLSE
jgi:hypothetical protein